MFYKKHMFLCTNKKINETGCGFVSPDDAFDFLKNHLLAHDAWGEGKFRVSKSGCLGRCGDGPVCVIYPDNVWYSYIDTEDLKQIVDDHLLNNQPVERLRI